MKQKQESLKYKDTFCILNFTTKKKKFVRPIWKKKKKNPKQNKNTQQNLASCFLLENFQNFAQLDL